MMWFFPDEASRFRTQSPPKFWPCRVAPHFNGLASSVFTHNRFETSERASPSHQTDDSQHHHSCDNKFPCMITAAREQKSTSTASHLTARSSYHHVLFSRTPLHPSSRAWQQNILTRMATKAANYGRHRSRHVLPNPVEGGIRIRWWRLEVCCKRPGYRSALRWEAADETQSRLQVLLLVACVANRERIVGLVRYTSFLLIEEVCLLI
jgi:hypothetical protein